MLPSAPVATALLALAAATAPALAAHPEHYHSLHHRPEPHLTLRHATIHAPSRHTHPTARRSHHTASTAHLRHSANLPSHRLLLTSRHAALIAQPHSALVAQPLASPTGNAAPASVVAVIRPAGLPRPQLPSIADEATEPVALPRLYTERGRLLVPAALVGSHDILLHQNQMADQDGLGRIQNDADLDAMRARGMLVSLPAGAALAIDPRLPLNRRFSRPWTAQFLAQLSRDYYNRFHSPLQLTSAVRTVEFQQQLMHRNGNAAPADGDTASPHLTGQAIDLGKRGMTLPQIAWMRGYLLPLIQSGKIDVEEEFKQSCFHISVYRAYAPPATERYAVASRATTSSLATILP